MDLVLLQQVKKAVHSCLLPLWKHYSHYIFHDPALFNVVMLVWPLPNTMQMLSIAKIRNLDLEEAQTMVKPLWYNC